MFPANPNQNPFQPTQAPSIKITQGMFPQGNRLTMPVGTYFSNPSSAANGVLGGSTPQLGMAAPQLQGSSFSNFLKDVWKWATQPSLPGKTGNPFQTINNAVENTPPTALQKLAEPQSTPTSGFTPAGSSTSSFQPNYLVGSSMMAATPEVMSSSVLQTIFPGRNAAEIQRFMASKGYTFRPSNKAGQGGGQWVLDPNSPAAQQVNTEKAPLGQGDFYGYVYNSETGKSERVIKNKSTSNFYNELRWDESTKSYQKIGKLLAQGKLDLNGKTINRKKNKGGGGGGGNYAANNIQGKTDGQQGVAFNQLVNLRVNYG